MDIGCGRHKIVPSAFGVDMIAEDNIDHNTKDLYTLDEQLPAKAGTFDVVYSSHCLEHVHDPIKAIKCWSKMLKPMGLLILYLPDSRHYNNDNNIYHLQSFEYKVFMRWFQQFKNLKVIESNQDIGEDRYSFYLVAQKMNW